MQGVAELVERGADLVGGQQRRAAVRRARHVEAHGDDGAVPEQVRLVDEGRHPGPAPLGRPGEPVADEQAETAAVGVGDLEDPHVRVVAGQVGPLDEAEPVQPGGRGQHAAVQHLLQLQVGAQVVPADREPLGPDPGGVVGVVPRLERPVVAVGVQGRLQLGGLGPGVGRGHRRHAGQHPVDGLHRAGGLVVQDVVGVAAEAEQAGPLGAQGGHPGEQRPGVGVPAQPAGHRRLVETTTHVAVLQRGERGLRGGQHERDEPAVQAPVLGGGAGRGQGVGAEPGGLGLVGEVERRRVRRVGHLGVEALRERGQLGVDLAEALLAGLRQGGARADEVAVVALEQPGLVGGQAQVRPARVQGVDPGEEPLVEEEGVGVRGPQGRELGVDGTHAGRRVGAGQGARHRHHAVQQPAAALQGEHGVLEGRLVGLRGHRLPLGPLLRDPGRHRRRQVLLTDPVERGQPVRQRAGRRERVVRVEGGSGGRCGRAGSGSGHGGPP